MAGEAGRRAKTPSRSNKGDAMETKAHHFLIGGTALLTAVAGVILAIWIARISFEETLPYRVYFEDPVTDLAPGAAVRLNGVRIGSVEEIELDPAKLHQALVTIEIVTDIVITEDSTAALESEGLIGPAYVGINIGSVDAPPLRHDAPEPPIIASERSGLNQIMAMAPEILDQVAGITANFETVSAEIARHREEIGALIADAARTASSFERAAEEAVVLVSEATGAVQRANDMIAQLDDVLDRRLDPMMANAEGTLAALAGTAEEAEQLIADTRPQIGQFATHGLREISQLVAEARRMVDDAANLVALLERHPTSILFGAPEPTFRPEDR
jgi:phospholipid/cholesterol/gamma-HCH transport system substrate-binding protein